MRAQARHRLLFCMKLHFASILCFPKYLETTSLTNILARLLTQKHIATQPNKNAFGKPETPQVGLGDTETYQSAIYINEYDIHSNQYLWIYPIGIK